VRHVHIALCTRHLSCKGIEALLHWNMSQTHRQTIPCWSQPSLHCLPSISYKPWTTGFATGSTKLRKQNYHTTGTPLLGKHACIAAWVCRTQESFMRCMHMHWTILQALGGSRHCHAWPSLPFTMLAMRLMMKGKHWNMSHTHGWTGSC
jgi:hypothetical protein